MGKKGNRAPRRIEGRDRSYPQLNTQRVPGSTPVRSTGPTGQAGQGGQRLEGERGFARGYAAYCELSGACLL